MDKDNLLPLVEQNADRIAGAMNLNPDFASGYMKGMVEQRDKDWERVKPLVDFLEGQIICPCCLEIWACLADCTLQEDVPEGWEKITTIRELLNEALGEPKEVAET